MIDSVAWNDINSWSFDAMDQIIVGDSSNQFFGPEGDSNIFVRDDQIVYAHGGNDTIHCNGNDTVYGNKGDDWISSKFNQIQDVIYGGQGHDHIYPEVNDIVYGNKGNDVLRPSDGSAIYYGGQDYDRIATGSGNDIVYGNKGPDQFSQYMFGYIKGGGHDTVYGGSGVDTLNGSLEGYYPIEDFSFIRNPDNSLTIRDNFGRDIITAYDVEYLHFGENNLQYGYLVAFEVRKIHRDIISIITPMFMLGCMGDFSIPKNPPR